MHNLLPALLFSISANIDNLTVAIAYGIKKIRIDIRSNIFIALISAFGTLISMTIGLILSRIIPSNITSVLGSIILIGMGIWFVIVFFDKKYKTKGILAQPEKIDSDNSCSIDVKESIILALALTINNFGLGIGASLTGLNILMTISLTFILSIVTIITGYQIGEGCFSKVLGDYAPLISGIIIIFLGLYEILF